MFPKGLGGSAVGKPVFGHVGEKIGLPSGGEDGCNIVVSRGFVTIGWIRTIAKIGPMILVSFRFLVLIRETYQRPCRVQLSTGPIAGL